MRKSISWSTSSVARPLATVAWMPPACLVAGSGRDGRAPKSNLDSARTIAASLADDDDAAAAVATAVATAPRCETMSSCGLMLATVTARGDIAAVGAARGDARPGGATLSP